MKKTGVLLLGDSIRMGYQQQVKECLGEEYDVFGSEDNGRFAKYTLNMIRTYLSEYALYVDGLEKSNDKQDGEIYDTPSSKADLINGRKPDIIHWNNGLWDTAIVCDEDGAFTPIEEYIRYCSIILRELRKITPNIIFATTTPVKDGSLNQNDEYIRAHNKAITEFMHNEGVVINDLYSIVNQDKEKFIREDCIHLNEEGKALCGKAVSDCIRKMKNDL